MTFEEQAQASLPKRVHQWTSGVSRAGRLDTLRRSSGHWRVLQ